ncbi:MAG: inositol monophosphatase family protein [Bacteroidales bacterium]|nr:inositol monophosphatase family protein [Bacteroidales bacterium]
MTEITNILLAAIGIAREAGKIQMAHFRSASLGVQTKGNDFDIVTAADKACEAFVKSRVHELFPTHSILSEETGADDVQSPWQWVVDPVDGTTNFKAGLPYFTISIGIRYEGETVIGVVYAPRLDELFTAVKGEGARLNGEPIACSTCQQMAQAVVCTGFPYDKAENPANNIAEAARVIPLVRGFRRMGSASLDICYTAAGIFDAFWELNLHIWDVCAAYLIAQEAGCEIHSLRPDRGYSPLIAPKSLVAPMLQVLNP